MQGYGTMQFADGSRYEGAWENNLMHGEGVYIDPDQIKWVGIFINGSFESKIQKKLHSEKLLKDKMRAYEEKAKEFFTNFQEAFARSDKKTFKDNLIPFFANADLCGELVSEPYPKYEERPPDKWNEWIKNVYGEARCRVKALGNKDEASLIPKENVLVE